MIQRRVFRWVGLFLGLILLSAHAVGAQETADGRLRITRVDTADFPTVQLNLIATDGQSQRLTDPAGLTLREAGVPVTDFTLADVPAGLDVIFVLDANAAMFSVDDNGSQTRLSKATASLIRFATQYMSLEEQDHVSVVIPAGVSGSEFLVQDETRPGDLSDAIEAYAPEILPNVAPLPDLLSLALTQAATYAAAGSERFPAIVLLSDGAESDWGAAIDTVAAEAQAGQIPVLVLVLGARVDETELANVTRLTSPTLGSALHMPNAPDADPLFGQLQANASQTQLAYQSPQTESGEYELQVGLGALQAEATLSLELISPEIVIRWDEASIRRAGMQPNTPLADLQPAVQTLEAQITWPGQPLELAEVVVLVDGEAQRPLSPPVVDTTGRLRLDWDISGLDEGSYSLAIRVTDSTGRETASEPVTVAVTVTRPAAPTATPSPPTPTPAPELSPALSVLERNPTWLFGLGLLGLFVLLLGLLLTLRRRRSRPGVTSEPSLAELLEEQGLSPLPAGVADSGQGPCLVVLQNGPEHSNPIPLLGDNISIGRDPKLVQVPLADQSVSRLHARIRLRKGEYWLYDEGSASGTYLNFNRLGLAPHILQEGDVVHIGRVQLRFQMTRPGGPVDVAPPPAGGQPDADWPET